MLVSLADSGMGAHHAQITALTWAIGSVSLKCKTLMLFDFLIIFSSFHFLSFALVSHRWKLAVDFRPTALCVRLQRKSGGQPSYWGHLSLPGASGDHSGRPHQARTSDSGRWLTHSLLKSCFGALSWAF